MKKTRLQKLLCLGMTVCLLTGCGGEYTGISGDGAVSGSAVSGSAVSGSAVSGPAIENVQESQETAGQNEYTFCNDKNLYYIEWDMIERSLEDGSERSVAIKDLDSICYVDNDWVYYTKYDGSLVEETVWRAPVEREHGWQLNEQKEELVLKEKERFDVNEKVWCDGTYIVYVSNETYRYRQYNIAEKKFEPNEQLEKRDDYVGKMVVCGGYVYIFYLDMGLVRKRLDTDEVEVLEEEYVDEVAAAGEDVFWSVSRGDGDREEIWMCYAKGEARQLITIPEIEKLLQKEKVGQNCVDFESHNFNTEGMFVREGCLYVQLAVWGKEKIDGEHVMCHNTVILRKELNSSGKLCLEKQLTRCLENPEENQEVFTKFMGKGMSECIFRNRGLCMCMVEDKCLMYVENTKKKENMWACYDFATGRFRYLTDQDEEWYLRYYDRYNIYIKEQLRDELWDMDVVDCRLVISMLPNNFDG